ncbi:hypothetical protein [Chryseobacterium sp.]|uniref:hypothetical protein n=1 Tax=Chryseobacterium sp. TaxID=1871047 RepID=UPI0028A2B54B|nr:hypothetical protein [Chryseobacterium sp.]
MKSYRKFGIKPNSETVWSEIFLIEYDINLSMDALKTMIDLQNQSLSVINEELYKKMEEIRWNNGFMEENELEQYITHLHGIEEKNLVELYNIQIANQIGAIFSVFENKMKMICEKIERNFNYQVPPKKGAYIPYYWKMIKGFILEESNQLERYYTPIYNKYIVRNILHHQNRIAEGKQYETFKHIQEIETKEFKNEYYIVKIDSKFCEILLSENKIFFEKLIEVLKKKTTKKLH